MSEKIRGAIFNALGDITDFTVLDAYSGTGAIAFEALSRGAVDVVALDADKRAATTIHQNSIVLGVEDGVAVSQIFARSWSRKNQSRQFDLVVLDPPYNAVVPKDLLALAKHAKPGGIIVVSLPPNSGFSYGTSLRTLISHKKYGDAEIFFYKQL
jgi:16S rRNA (guanine966-N2)-methyltransferase